ncbi:peritrophin-1-like [Saccostrea echinata]|uniref:peritrophin-1-like n=1 Tax=Saccostrea echinata TaxID=191078 RepID=UPI002A831783|nr:peritrophin-1-like [Saccostrea echinata]
MHYHQGKMIVLLLCFGVLLSLTDGKTKSCLHGSFNTHPTDCTMYQVCVHGYKLNMTCGFGTAWNQNISSCVDAAEMGCKFQGEISDSKGFSCPSTFGAFPDPKDCTKYYFCSYGRAISKQCQPNTGWDAKLKLCNYKTNLKTRGLKKVF